MGYFLCQKSRTTPLSALITSEFLIPGPNIAMGQASPEDGIEAHDLQGKSDTDGGCQRGSGAWLGLNGGLHFPGGREDMMEKKLICEEAGISRGRSLGRYSQGAGSRSLQPNEGWESSDRTAILPA